MPRVPPGLHRQEGKRLPRSRTQDVDAAGPPRRRIPGGTQRRSSVPREAPARRVLSAARTLQLFQRGDRTDVEVREVPGSSGLASLSHSKDYEHTAFLRELFPRTCCLLTRPKVGSTEAKSENKAEAN